MSKIEPQNTEESARHAWIKSLEANQPAKYVPTGVPVPDPSSHPQEPKDIVQAIK